MKRFIAVTLGASCLIVSACASHQPTPELVDARTAYARASSGPAAQYNPAGLYDGKRALDAAERKQEDSAGSDEARSLAYIANRKILLAEANARITVAQNDEANAKQQLAQLEQQQLKQAQGQLGAARTEIDQQRTQMQQQQQALQSEQKARQEADQRAKDALDRLNAFASVKQDTRGMVITLSGSVLFETNKADLMPAARARLSEVAQALKQVEGRRITVVGYTDNVGSDDYNKDLSKRRADSVRDFLVTQGVRQDLLSDDGKGKADPVASNATPEGRANNRRVEIVVEGANAQQ
ncbi:MAG TPA: OmpA family protein [Labilithrix sp.]